MTRGRSESRKRSVRGRSQTGRILRQPCRYNLKGTWASSLCEFWHPPENQFNKTESGCRAGDKCLFPHSKVEEHVQDAEKELQLSKRKKRRQSGGVAVMKTVPQLGCVSQDSAITPSEKREVSEKPEA